MSTLSPAVHVTSPVEAPSGVACHLCTRGFCGKWRTAIDESSSDGLIEYYSRRSALMILQIDLMQVSDRTIQM
jgi:hypothetical protein